MLPTIRRLSHPDNARSGFREAEPLIRSHCAWRAGRDVLHQEWITCHNELVNPDPHTDPDSADTPFNASFASRLKPSSPVRRSCQVLGRETKTNGCDLIFFPFFPARQVIHVILVFRATTHHTLETERSVLSATAEQLCIPLLFWLRTFKWGRK